MRKILLSLLLIVLLFSLCLTGCLEGFSDILDGINNGIDQQPDDKNDPEEIVTGGWISIEGIPDYSGEVYTYLNDGDPQFESELLTTKAYEFYSELDSLGRCGYVIASIGKETMPAKDEERGSISSVYPSGWVQAKYDFVDGGYLYNRCHLIGWQLTAENANKKNLVTGTKQLNNDGMLPFENMVADYIHETGNHVLYRVTPIYVGDNLVCSGIQIEAYSVEDDGDGICFNIFVYNVQPGVYINYKTGESRLATEEDGIIGDTESETQEPEGGNDNPEGAPTGEHYVLNTNTKKYHKPTCASAEDMSEHNKQDYYGDEEELANLGYEPCGRCKP